MPRTARAYLFRVSRSSSAACASFWPSQKDHPTFWSGHNEMIIVGANPRALLAAAHREIEGLSLPGEEVDTLEDPGRLDYATAKVAESKSEH